MRNVIHFLAKVGQLCAEREGQVQTRRLEHKPAFLRREGGGVPHRTREKHMWQHSSLSRFTKVSWAIIFFEWQESWNLLFG